MKESWLEDFCVLFCFGDFSRAALRSHSSRQSSECRRTLRASGLWYCKDPNGTTSTKYLDLQQKGNIISGHFKGPNQSGGVEGTIDGQRLVVKTKTRDVLTFGGRVEGPRVDGVVQGNSYNGNFHDRGGPGSFQGVRAN